MIWILVGLYGHLSYGSPFPFHFCAFPIICIWIEDSFTLGHSNCFNNLFTGTLLKHFMLQAFSLRLYPSLGHFSQMWVSLPIDYVLVIQIEFRLLFSSFKISIYSWSKNGNMQSGKQQISGRLWKREGSHSLVHLLVMKIFLLLQVHLPVQMYGLVPNLSLSFDLLTEKSYWCIISIVNIEDTNIKYKSNTILLAFNTQKKVIYLLNLVFSKLESRRYCGKKLSTQQEVLISCLFFYFPLASFEQEVHGWNV